MPAEHADELPVILAKPRQVDEPRLKDAKHTLEALPSDLDDFICVHFPPRSVGEELEKDDCRSRPGAGEKAGKPGDSVIGATPDY